mmetsp:Transcript_19248/g.35980  ORF Transcript_19248/g.35980 Transcript_19248/m.35980 type:complete len:93 (+) Transcript_19248:491-769(+)
MQNAHPNPTPPPQTIKPSLTLHTSPPPTSSHNIHAHRPLPLARMDQLFLIIDHIRTEQTIAGITQSGHNISRLGIQFLVDVSYRDADVGMMS